MDVEIPVLAGYLNVPTQTGFSLNRISKKKTCSRYCLLFKSSRHGIERLEICESKDDKNPKIFTLENCVKITQEPSPANLIHIVKKNDTLTLNTLTDECLKEWIMALQTVAFGDNNGAQAAHGGAIEEDNDLYCSSVDGLFIITLIPSEASKRCNIEPKAYMLLMTATELQLKSVEDLNVIIAKWPYRFIRKYGYRDGKFTFEAGRKCSTGEGVFTLDHTNPQEVFRCITAKMKSMKKLISGDSLNSIDCVENQFSAAASMEPGSRSPLPPSPSNQLGSEFEMNSTQSCLSIRGFISSNDSLNNFSTSTSNSATNVPVIQQSSVKHIPNKPPRKLPTTPPISTQTSSNTNNVMHTDKFKKIISYEPVAITTSTCIDNNNKNTGSTVILTPASPETLRSGITAKSGPPDLPFRNESAKCQLAERDYECIEHITDAWKTLGVSDVKHCERICENDTPFVWQRSQSQRDKRHKETTPNTTPKIIDIDIGERNSNCCAATTAAAVTAAATTATSDSAYDRLDFLSPNNRTSSGYKTIVTVTSTGSRLRCSPPPPNEYELIASPDMEICRKADDTHLGYGVLRKTITNNTAIVTAATSTSSGTSTTSVTSNSNNINNINANAIEELIPLNSLTTLTPVNNTKSTPLYLNTNKSNNNHDTLDHRNYNGLSYTIVSKPKRV